MGELDVEGTPEGWGAEGDGAPIVADAAEAQGSMTGVEGVGVEVVKGKFEDFGEDFGGEGVD